MLGDNRLFFFFARQRAEDVEASHPVADGEAEALQPPSAPSGAKEKNSVSGGESESTAVVPSGKYLVMDESSSSSRQLGKKLRGLNSRSQSDGNIAESHSFLHSDIRDEGKPSGATNGSDEQPSSSNRVGFEWFPRMDVVESGTSYVVTIELPGVSVEGIQVEVVRDCLTVTGSRAREWWKSNGNGVNGGGTVYHRRELAYGPYRTVWRLPKNSDVNNISAEFIQGFLRILVPKLKIMAYL